MVILCHKCAGTLTQHNDPRLYGCGCISGYVRDWQKPISYDEACKAQLEVSYERLELYRSQGREENGGHIQDTLSDIERLTR
jgi:hypothetical protein